MLSRRQLILAAPAVLPAAARPNIIFIFIDDLGYGDFGVTGNRDVPTPNIDRLAQEGTLFRQFYVASPICSPSRTAVVTGQYPARHRICSYFADHKNNQSLGMPDWLNPQAPSVARTFQQAGYATGHFGKWHLGGGRDVGDAPLPQAYGFDESVTSFEGLGDRLLIEGDGLSKQSAALGRGQIEWLPKHKLTEVYIDKALAFIDKNKTRPFYLHLWPCDVHDNHVPRKDLLAKYEKFSANPHQQRFYAVLDEFDRQIGRLLDALIPTGLAQNTIVALTGDNGPTAWPRYYANGDQAPGSTAGLRGRKWSLYEGGIRLPLLVRWPGHIPAGRVDQRTVVTAVDLFPTFCSRAGLPKPNVQFDSEDMSSAWRGRTHQRKRAIFWEYGRDQRYLQPGLKADQSPNLAVRDGHWKLLLNADGSSAELYDFRSSDKERDNVAARHPAVTQRPLGPQDCQAAFGGGQLPVPGPILEDARRVRAQVHDHRGRICRGSFCGFFGAEANRGR